jgi:uncharacterized membrane protein
MAGEFILAREEQKRGGINTMNSRIRHIWERLRTSYWFVPGGIVIAAIVSGHFLLLVDREWGGDFLRHFGAWTEDVSAEGVRSLLSTVASSVLALAGVSFSGMLVALTLASGQFGSRLLRNFIREPANQVTLGVLLGNFVFCLIVLRSVRVTGTIPQISTTVAFLITLASLAVFIFFIHNLAISLQADEIVRKVHKELDETIDRFFPDEMANDAEDAEAEAEKEQWLKLEDGEHFIRSKVTGYVAAIYAESIVNCAQSADVRCRVLRKAGQFVNIGAPLMAVRGGISSEIEDELLNGISVEGKRMAEQDFEYCMRQLVEIALRALSPGINDPYTAINCIDYLGAALAKVAGRQLPEQEFDDEDGVERLLMRPVTFESMLEEAVFLLRQAGDQKPDISIRLLESLMMVGQSAQSESRRKTIAKHGKEVASSILKNCDEADRASVESAYNKLTETLQNATT